MEKEITQEEIQEIERLTGGKIGTHTFGTNNEHALGNSFLSPDGTYIGNFEQAQWYVDNKMMVDEDYPEEQWNEYETKFADAYQEEDELGRKWMDEDGISYVIPFKLRGSKIIETMEEAFEAAKNMSKYLS